MNLRIIPAIPTAPTVIFSLNWHAPPASLPLSSFYATQLASCQDSHIPQPRNALALDKAVGFHLLIESVTFDLAKGQVSVSWVDGVVIEWPLEEGKGFKECLEDVLECVKRSGVEAEKEKRVAAQAALAAATKGGHARSESLPATTSETSVPSSSGHRRHRTASGIFSSLVATFITPANSSGSASLARRSSTSSTSSITSQYHRQHIFHPLNARPTLPTTPVAHSRSLRRQARAKLVDVFRLYVSSRLLGKMRETGIVGAELRDRGILDDLDDDEDMDVEEVKGPNPGTAGYVASGGYVAFMARSMLRNALQKERSESESSSDDESLLMTPKDTDKALAADVPSDCSSSSSRPSSPSSSRKTAASSRTSVSPSSSRRSPTPTHQSRQIHHLSSVLIGITQKDKRTTADERSVLNQVQERSLRRRWSLSELNSKHRMDRSVDEARTKPVRCGWRTGVYGKPLVGSPLRVCETLEFPTAEGAMDVDSDVHPFPMATATRRAMSLPTVSMRLPFDEDAEEDVVSLDSQTVQLAGASFTLVKPKAAEAEDVKANGRPRCTALLPSTEQSAPSEPRGHTRSASCPPSLMIFTATPTDSTDSDSTSDDESQYALSPDPSCDMDIEVDICVAASAITQPRTPGTLAFPTPPTSPMEGAFKKAGFGVEFGLSEVVRGLELDSGEERVGGRWCDGIFVV